MVLSSDRGDKVLAKILNDLDEKSVFSGSDKKLKDLFCKRIGIVLTTCQVSAGAAYSLLSEYRDYIPPELKTIIENNYRNIMT